MHHACLTACIWATYISHKNVVMTVSFSNVPTFLEGVQVFQLAPYAGQVETCTGVPLPGLVETLFFLVDTPHFIHKNNSLTLKTL